jgi:hypothetical protein
LHINAECLHLEFEMDNKPVRAGQPGHLLVTDFDNFGMPFIRYEIGDLGVPLSGSCTCGRSLPLMDVAAGRVSDFVLSPHDGSLVSGAIIAHDLVAEGPNVGQLQIIQDAPDHLTLRVKSTGQGQLNETQSEYLEEVIGRIFHGAMRVTFEQVNSIQREKSGKFRVCINNCLGPSATENVLCFENSYGSSKGATGCLSARVSGGLSSALADKQPVAPFSKHVLRAYSKTPENMFGWLGQSAAVPQETRVWGFAALSHQPPDLSFRIDS